MVFNKVSRGSCGGRKGRGVVRLEFRENRSRIYVRFGGIGIGERVWDLGLKVRV